MRPLAWFSCLLLLSAPAMGASITAEQEDKADIDRDGIVSQQDVDLLQQFLDQMNQHDINGDGKVDEADMTMITEIRSIEGESTDEDSVQEESSSDGESPPAE